MHALSLANVKNPYHKNSIKQKNVCCHIKLRARDIVKWIYSCHYKSFNTLSYEETFFLFRGMCHPFKFGS